MNLVEDRVLVFDGAMGTMLQKQASFVRCLEELNLSDPSYVQSIHEEYLKAGADIVETNTFGASYLELKEHGLSKYTYEINLSAANFAIEVARDYGGFVAGSIGPGRFPPTAGKSTLKTLIGSYEPQVKAFLDAGVDAIIVETVQDPLQAKAVCILLYRLLKNRNKRPFVFLQFTVERNGRLLFGTTPLAALYTFMSYPFIDCFGFNCSLGPDSLLDHVRLFAKNVTRAVSVQPNAGLPEQKDGELIYSMTPDTFARHIYDIVNDTHIEFVGGCCGTTPEFIKKIKEKIKSVSPRKRKSITKPYITSLYQATPLFQNRKILIISERCNATGSKRFRELLLSQDLDAIEEFARDQERLGAQAMDISVAMTTGDEIEFYKRIIPRLARSLNAPLVFDSTELLALQEALALYPGRAIINSLNFIDGEDRFIEGIELVKEHAASVIISAMDEDGMAEGLDRKKRIFERAYNICVNKMGLEPTDILFDPLTFSIADGSVDSRKRAWATLEAVRWISENFEGSGSVLGISNVSHGLKGMVRDLINSVFLAIAKEKGLTAAIVNPSKIIYKDQIDSKTFDLGTKLFLTTEGDPLFELIEIVEAKRSKNIQGEIKSVESIEDPVVRLKEMIIEGRTSHLSELVKKILMEKGKNVLLEEVILPAMEKVGVLFEKGSMQLPYVMKSAEVSSKIVSYLKQHSDQEKLPAKATFILATVEGDVHDIGKNLVKLVIENSGYEVIDLGIQVPVEKIIEAREKYDSVAIGMSGLLVKSAMVMKDNLVVFSKRGLDIPVIVGGAALNRRFVEKILAPLYPHGVYYAKDGFECKKILDKICNEPKICPVRKNSNNRLKEKLIIQERGSRRILKGQYPAIDVKTDLVKIVKIDPEKVRPYINKTFLFKGQWKFKKRDFSDAEELFNRVWHDITSMNDIKFFASYGFFRATVDDNLLIIQSSLHSFKIYLPRQNKPDGLSISDFFRAEQPVVVGLFAVTTGKRIKEYLDALKKEGRFQDYVLISGLSATLAEALAEYVHKMIREEAGIEKDLPVELILKGSYQGARFSPGYSSIPDLSIQKDLYKILNLSEIDMEVTENFQLVPSHSITAVVSFHPDAHYINV